jgi:hypothetical protein
MNTDERQTHAQTNYSHSNSMSYVPPNDGRIPQELFEIIQIPPGRNPFKYENLWETELCDFFEDCSDCK